jgi:hypothetical protein
MFQFIIEFGLFVLVILVGISQVVIPWSKGQRAFPVFRPAIKQAEEHLAETVQKVAVQEIQLEEEKLKARLKTEAVPPKPGQKHRSSRYKNNKQKRKPNG